MKQAGLGDCIPARKGPKKCARSLAAKTNRDMSEWTTKEYKFTPLLKRMMIGRLIQMETITLMSSSCYSFGGKIFIQSTGAGIGERGSACVAKTVMSMWDKLWARRQLEGVLRRNFSLGTLMISDCMFFQLEMVGDGRMAGGNMTLITWMC